jgi:hypothetical protein
VVAIHPGARSLLPIPLAAAPVGFVTTDQASRPRAQEAVVPDDMSGNAADHSTLGATRRPGWAGRQTDNSQHRGCRNKHRLHQHLLLGWIAAWLGEPPFGIDFTRRSQ